jgi:endoglucanase
MLLCMIGVAEGQTLKGVNLAGAAFSPTRLPGTYGQDFIFPTGSEMDYFTAKGMNVFRLSILWERLQPKLGGPLDDDEMSRLESFIAIANQHGASVIIDLHNYGLYRGVAVTQSPALTAGFADVWARLARQFGQNNKVLFGLMNEPQIDQAADWQAAVQGAIDAIRKTGAKNQILVSGTQWDSAAGFAGVSGDTLGSLNDPAHRLIFEVHEYFDTDSSGTADFCVDQAQALSRLAPFTQWLRQTGSQGFLGEFGLSRRPECLAVLNAVLQYLHTNADVWTGWTYWAAGPAWGDYMFTIEPENGADRPQMLVLEKYLKAPAADKNQEDNPP